MKNLSLHTAKQRLIKDSKRFHKLEATDPRFKHWADYYDLIASAKDLDDLWVAYQLAFFQPSREKDFEPIIKAQPYTGPIFDDCN